MSSSFTENKSRKSTEGGSPFERIVVLIPALNEESSLPKVLKDLPDVGHIIVTDNGSTDRTAELATAAGAIVVKESQRGYGAACLRAMSELKRLVENSEADPDVVVFLDADYADDPKRLPELVNPILANQFDFVLSSRMLGEREPGAMPMQARWGNRLACFLMWLMLGYRYTDLGPFRAIRYSELLALNMRDQNYGWTIEMQIKAGAARLRTLEIPMPYRVRIGQSKISGTLIGTVSAGYKILKVVFTYGLAALFRRSEPDSKH